jgi:hypothetical protein
MKAERQAAAKNNNNDIVDESYQKREDVHYTMFPAKEGQVPLTYCFAVIPDRDGMSVRFAEVATIKRHKFTSPKDGQHYFENLKMFMDAVNQFTPAELELVDRVQEELSDEEKATVELITRHEGLMRRYRQLLYQDDINFGWSQKPTMATSRLRKLVVSMFFGRWTKWKDTVNPGTDNKPKLIYSIHKDFEGKMVSFLEGMGEKHDELQPNWFEDYFSHVGGVQGILEAKMGCMKVGSTGSAINLIKLGKDPIDAQAVGMMKELNEKDIEMPTEPENELSHFHYYMGVKSTMSISQKVRFDKFEEALEQLEKLQDEAKERKAAVEGQGSDNKTGAEATGQSTEAGAEQKVEGVEANAEAKTDDAPF